MVYVLSEPAVTWSNAPAVYAFGSSGVLVEEQWVVTAAHVGDALGVRVQDVPCTVLQQVRIPGMPTQPDGSRVFDDMKLVRVAEPQSAWSRLASAKPAVGDTVLVGGYGLSLLPGRTIPFTIPTDVAYQGLRYCTAQRADYADVYGAPPSNDLEKATDDGIIVWIVRAPPAHPTTTGWIGLNDSGCPVWKANDGEYYLVGLGLIGISNGLSQSPPVVIDYYNPPDSVRGSGCVSYVQGTSLGMEYKPVGYDSMIDWIEAVIFAGQRRSLCSSAFRGWAFASSGLRGEAGQPFWRGESASHRTAGRNSRVPARTAR